MGVVAESLDGLELAGRFQWNKARRKIGLREDQDRQIGLEKEEACMFQFNLPSREPRDKTYRFRVIFAGDYTVERLISVAGAGGPHVGPVQQPAARPLRSN